MAVMKTPQEIEVWYVIPAIRRELALNLVNGGVSQKETARILGITEAAVSQYINAKRAKDIVFDKDIKERIREAAKRMAKNKELVMQEIQDLCSAIKKSSFLCKIHRANSRVPKNCCICLK